MTAYLRCKAGRGLFSGEIAVQGSTASGEEFSLFVPEEYVECRAPLQETTDVDALLCVDVLAQDAQFLLVRLPAEAFENGRTVTVERKQIEERTAQQA